MSDILGKRKKKVAGKTNDSPGKSVYNNHQLSSAIQAFIAMVHIGQLVTHTFATALLTVSPTGSTTSLVFLIPTGPVSTTTGP